MRRSLSQALLAAALLLGACGQAEPTTPELMPGFDPGPVPPSGIQVILPIVRAFPAGESKEICTWTNVITEQDIDIKSSRGVQSKIGHHVILFYTTKHQPAGQTRECSDDDMASFRFAIGGDGLNVSAPGDLVFHIPKGAQLVMNHHYLNATPTAIDAQSAMNLYFATPSPSNIRAGNVAFVDTSLRIPPGPASLDIDCSVPRDMKLWHLMPHMHRWGDHIKIDLTSAGQKSTLFDLKWQEDFTFHAPIITRDPKDPFQFRKGDRLQVHCDWNNTTGKPMTFGMEMCVAFGMTVDTAAEGNIACDKGEWGEF